MRLADVVIVVRRAGEPDREVQPSGPIVTIGRAADNDIVLSGSMIARRHLRLSFAAETVMVDDLGETPAAWIDGSPVWLHGAQLPDEAVLRIGEHEISIRRCS